MAKDLVSRVQGFHPRMPPVTLLFARSATRLHRGWLDALLAPPEGTNADAMVVTGSASQAAALQRRAARASGDTALLPRILPFSGLL